MTSETRFLLATYIGQTLLALVLAVLLAVFLRRYDRVYLRDWARSWTAFAVYLAGAASGLLLWRIWPASHPVRLTITILSLAAGWAQVAWLLIGTLVLVTARDLPPPRRRPIVWTALAFGSLSALAFTWDPDAGSLRILLRVGLRALVAGIAFLAASVLVLRHPGAPRALGARLLGGAFGAYGVTQLWYAAGFGLDLAGATDVTGTFDVLAVADLVIQTIMGLGMIIWLLEEEQGRLLTAERRLAESRAEQAAIVNAMTDLAWTVDTEVRLVTANRSFLEAYRLTVGRVPEPGDPLLDGVDPTLRAQWQPLYDRALAGEPVRVRYHYNLPGVPPDLEITITPLRDADGAVRGATVFARDISDEVRADEERRRREAADFETQRLESLGVLAGGIAHDFNNLLTGVIGNADLLLEDLAPDDPRREPVAEIGALARRGAELTQQMLSYAGGRPSSRAPVSLTALADDMAAMVRSIVSKKATVVRELAPDLRAVDGDQSELRQVLLNLLTNASEALGDGPGTITIRTRQVVATEVDLAPFRSSEPLPPGRYVVLEVADTGEGMNRRTQDRIFDPFFTTRFAGRGLGLAVVAGVVRRHGGGIAVDTEPGRGTTFRIALPAAAAAAAVAAPPPRPVATGRGHGCVLVVDDEAAVRRLCSKVLQRAGYDTVEAADGLAALEVFAAQAGDLTAVILDLTMPGLDGAEVLARIRQRAPALPVLLCSGYSEDAAPRDAHTAFVHKPWEPAELLRALNNLAGTG